MRPYVLALACLWPVAAGALSLQTDVVYTDTAPGYFFVTTYPDETSEPLAQNDVFLRKYPTDKHEQYREILQIIRAGGGVVMSPSQYQTDAPDGARVATLGSGETDENTFTLDAQSPTPGMDFVRWAERHRPVQYAEHIDIQWPPELREATRLNPGPLTADGTSWIGKYTHAGEHKFTLRAESGNKKTAKRVTFSTLEPDHVVDEATLKPMWDEMHKSPYLRATLWWWIFLASVLLGLIAWGVIYRKKTTTHVGMARDEIPLFTIPQDAITPNDTDQNQP